PQIYTLSLPDALPISSAGAAAAGSILLLAVFRINQAIAAAALVPNGLGLLREAIPSGRRGAEFGIVSAATAVGATVGPLVGGFLDRKSTRLNSSHEWI